MTGGTLGRKEKLCLGQRRDALGCVGQTVRWRAWRQELGEAGGQGRSLPLDLEQEDDGSTPGG